MIKLKVRDTHRFLNGMREGIIDYTLQINDINRAIRPNSSWRKYDYDAFTNGYNLANSDKYLEAWKAEKNLLFTAIQYGDVFPIDWKISGNINGNYINIV